MTPAEILSILKEAESRRFLGLESLPNSGSEMSAEFRRVFGHDRNFKLVHSELKVSESILASLSGPAWTDKDKREHCLVPTDPTYDPGLHFRSTRVACVCEVRGAAYLAASLQTAGVSTKILSATSAEVKTDLYRQSFIALGAKSNQMTDQLLRNSANQLVNICVTNIEDPYFSSFRGKRLTPKRGKTTDFGLIVGIHPEPHRDKTWIACAGLGEHGTSGAAYYLAFNWFDIAARINHDMKQFACIVKVDNQENADSSASLMQFALTETDWNEFSP